MKVVVLGGYGAFGASISRGLASIQGMRVVVAGRDAARAGALAGEIGAQALVLDARSRSLAAELARSGCEWVVHTAGPFQDAAYDVASAAIDAGVNYVDIADARGFVCGIVALDARARARGVAVISGASSVPALSSAVVDLHAREFARLEAIDLGIVSSSRLPGNATVMGSLAACGRPMQVWDGGRWRQARGWRSPRRYTFSLVPMTRWVSDCDVPDLALMPARYPALRRVTFGAGAGSAAGQWALFAASMWGRIARLPEGVRRVLVGLGHLAAPFGPARSGMFVRMSGTGPDGRALTVTWELVAENHRGRAIPALGVVALLRKAAAGAPPPPGAQPCVGLVGLDEYLAELRGLPAAAGVARSRGGGPRPAGPPMAQDTDSLL